MTAEVHDRTVVDGELRIALRDYSGSGRPIVLVHGGGDNLETWAVVAPLLARRHRVVALDLPGHGWSSMPVRVSNEEFVGALRAVITELGLADAWLVGHSIGARLVALYAANWPCAGVVMVEGTFWRFRLDVRPPSDEQFAEMIAETGFGWKGDAEALAIEQERLLGQLPEGARRYVPVRKLRERSFVQVGDHFERRPTAELVRAQVHWVPGEHPSYANDPDQFARIRCPIHGVFGTTGPHSNERDEVEEPFRSNDNADVHWLKGGHFLPFEDPTGVVGLIESAMPE